MKKLITKSAMVAFGYMAFAFIASSLLAALTNTLYWDVPSSWVYHLTNAQYTMFVGVTAIVIFAATITCIVLRIIEEVKHYKEIRNIGVNKK